MDLLKELVSLNETKSYSFKSEDGTRTAKKTYNINKGLYTVKFFKNGMSAGKDYASDGDQDTEEIAKAYVDKDEEIIKDLGKSAGEHLKTLKEETTHDTPAEAKVRKSAIEMMRSMGVPSKETNKLKTCSYSELERQMKLFQNHVAAFRGSK